MASLSTLRTDAYNTIYNLLQTGTYAISTSNIHPRYNDAQLKQEGLPQVIIDVKIAKVKANLDGTLKDATVTYEVEVRHNSAANLRALMDEIDNKIDTGVAVFTAAGLSPREQPSDSGSEENYYVPKKTMHVNILFYEYRFMGSV